MPSLGDFLSGYRGREAQMNAAPMQELQQVGALQGILAKVQAAKQEQELRGVLSQSGGDPAKAVQALLQAGTPQSIELAAKLKGLMPPQVKPQLVNTVATDGKTPISRFVTPREGDTYPTAIPSDTKGTWSEPYQLNGVWVQKNSADGKIQTAVTREPQTRIVIPPQPRNPQWEEIDDPLKPGSTIKVNPALFNEDAYKAGNKAGVLGRGTKTPPADKPMTEFQGKAALYGTRAAQSDKILKALEDKISTAGLAAGQATGVVGNALMSSEQQRVSQAQRDFVNAVLRQESGAVISDAEFANAKQQYFPAVNDSPQVRAQKRANRQLAIQGFKRMSGPKGAVDIDAIINEPLLPGVSAINPTPKQAGTGATGGWKVTPIP